jgi:hypothetical protein
MGDIVEYTYGVKALDQSYSRTDSRVSDDEFARRYERTEALRREAAAMLAKYQDKLRDLESRLEAMRYTARVRAGEVPDGEPPQGGAIQPHRPDRPRLPLRPRWWSSSSGISTRNRGEH